MNRTKKVNGVKYMCSNNANYIKGEGQYFNSCKKYVISMYDKQRKGWVQVGYCDTLREFHENI